LATQSASNRPERAILFITQFNSLASGGLGRYEQSLYPHLEKQVGARSARMEPWPLPEIALRAADRTGRDLRTTLQNFPCHIPNSSHIRLVHLSHPVLALSLLLQRPEHVVVTVHDLIPYLQMATEKFGRGELTGFWERRLYRIAIRQLRKAQRIIAVSGHTKRDINRYLHIPETSIEVIPLGVDRRTFHISPVPVEIYSRFGLNPSEQYLLYVGSLESRKNLPVLYRALCEVQHKIPKVRLLVAGSTRSSFSESHQALLQQMGIEKLVYFLGAVSESELTALYNLSRGLVMPSLYEGFGLPVIEAMACGCPVLASNTTSLPEVVGDAGRMVDPYDENAWVEAIGELLENEPLRRQFTEAGIHRAGHFTWEAAAEATAAVYQQALQ